MNCFFSMAFRCTTRALPLVAVGVISLPAQSGSTLVGNCYSVSAGEWSVPAKGDEPFWRVLPPVLRFDAAPADFADPQGLRWQAMRVMGGSMTEHPPVRSIWALAKTDTIRIRYYLSRSGLQLTLVPRGDSLVGTMAAHGDIVSRSGPPTASVSGKRIACPSS